MSEARTAKDPDEGGGPLEDAQSLERFRAGDPTFFNLLMQQHGSLVRGLARKYLRSDEDADDVCQQTFSRAFERRGSFRGEAPIRTWLCRIAINLAMNVRTRSARAEQGDDGLEEVASFTNALETSKLVAAELWKKAEQHLQNLPAKQRLVVELRLFHDLSFKEIGALADCSEASARVNFAHGVGTLRAVLKSF